MKRFLLFYICILPVILSTQLNAANYGDIIINEVMADPNGLTELPLTEYVEIYNTTNTSISLKDWSFIYIINDSSRTIVTLPEIILPPNGYAVLFRTGSDIKIDDTGIGLPISNFPANLANTGKELQLKDPHGFIIDSTTYSSTKPAQSWERDVDGTWHLSSDPRGGTPGSVNSQKDIPTPPIINPSDNSNPGDVIINEIMANPVGLTELPETEYIEIYNTSDATIPLHNWSFVYDGKAVTLPDTTLPIGGYAVLYRTGRDIAIKNTAIALPITNFPANLANTGKTIGLKNSHDTEIDIVTYTTATAARSWERDAENQWYLSTDQKGGTPGAINSPKDTSTPPIINPSDDSDPGDVIINEIMANPVGLTELPETEYVEIYNTSGATIPLHNWSFVYDGKAVMLPDTILPVNGYAVLYRTGRSITIENTAIALPITNFPANLANTGKTIGLKNSHDTEIDIVTYMAATAARSWERDAENQWYLSTNQKGGTPGAINSPKDAPTPPIINPSDDSNPGDVIINEIMANPVGLTELPETEYVEIYNTSATPIPLHNWSFIYDGKAVTLPDTTLPIGGYAVLYRTGRDIAIENTAIPLPITNFPANLANNGKTIGLKNSNDTEIDVVTYTTAKAARSWERDTEGEWYLSTDQKGGTPGVTNSPKESPEQPATNPLDHSKTGDVIINEIMANPTGLTGLPETEYVEIYNISDSAIYLKGWTFVYDEKEISFLDTILAIGSYAVLFRSGRDIHIEETGVALATDNFPANLANTGKTLQIKNSHQVIIDSISYAAAKAARSWERDMEGEWYLSNDPKGGTPGTANSLKDLPEQPTANPSDHSNPGDIIINEIMANPTGLTGLPETEYIEIYNTTDSIRPLKGWHFIYDGKTIKFPDSIIPANTYAVLFRAGRDIHIDQEGIAIAIENFPANLANTGKTVQIRNSHNTTIDSTDYTSAKAARSWERDNEGKWYLSTDPRGGTPGSVNSPKENTIPPAEPEEPVTPGNSGFGDIIINEVMANPVGLIEIPETEYVEIYNTLDSTIRLKGWSFVYDGKETAIPETLLSTNQYAVLFREGRDIYVESTGIALPITGFPANLANSGKMLQIRNSSGLIIDSVNYTTAKAARSWERDNEGSWYLSNDPKGGTPGAVNSSKGTTPGNPGNPDGTFMVYENELIFNELLPEPFAGGSEYLELYNRSERTLSLNNLSIATIKTDGTLSTHYPLKSIPDSVYLGQYIVLTGNRDGVLDFYYTSAPEMIYELKLPALNNTGATLVLLRTHDEFVIDRLTYSSKWHDIAIKNTKGVSLERIQPDADTQSAANWTSATAMVGYGTPGYINSQDGAIANDEHTIILNAPEYRPELNEYIITYQTDQPGYRCRIEIYAIEGRKVAEISNNQLIGTSGEIRWDGTGSDGSRLHAGIYVFYGELYHPAGKKRIYKKTMLMK
ncbi:MAG: lamin tail domain-containing protein [Tannerella sp.]|jgi:hypothetical protein|nr:lamin tail domain-containing protein [Tannerella sp.]